MKRYIPTKLRAMTAAIDGLIRAADSNCTIGTVSVEGSVDIQTCKWDNSRNGKNGIYRMRVREDYVAALMNLLHEHIVVTRLDPSNAAISAYNFETTVDSELYPGAVVEQIRVQAGVNAMPKRDFGSGNQDITYIMAIPDGAELSAIRERGYLAILDDRGQIYLSMID